MTQPFQGCAFFCCPRGPRVAKPQPWAGTRERFQRYSVAKIAALIYFLCASKYADG
jgi:hypothetical protein